jgi:hypothetical protein
MSLKLVWQQGGQNRSTKRTHHPLLYPGKRGEEDVGIVLKVLDKLGREGALVLLDCEGVSMMRFGWGVKIVVR